MEPLWEEKLATISTVTAGMQEFLDQVAGRKGDYQSVGSRFEGIYATTKEFEELTLQLQDQLAKAAPVIRNLEVGYGSCEQHSAASLDNPQTLSDLKQTIDSAAQLTATDRFCGRAMLLN